MYPYPYLTDALSSFFLLYLPHLCFLFLFFLFLPFRFLFQFPHLNIPVPIFSPCPLFLPSHLDCFFV
ncbi:hypothetical protein K523DRAFT_326096, partial [Schizophyllum commune Tattone D]